MFERRHQELLPRQKFYRRMARYAAAASFIVFSSLLAGVVGYHFSEGLSWIDSLLNASMILTGMGPANTLQTTAGKLFASGYALFSGLVFITAAGVLIAPVAHRFLHKFHLEQETERERR